MPDPTELIAVARALSQASAAADAALRRAVSTAYYAAFHTVLRDAATRFIGEGRENTAGYSILYRGFDHARMREICGVLVLTTMREKYRNALRRTSVSQDMRDFAGAFCDLQDVRHHADYDPTFTLDPLDALSWIDTAEAAIAAFDRVSLEEKSDVLALILVGARS